MGIGSCKYIRRLQSVGRTQLDSREGDEARRKKREGGREKKKKRRNRRLKPIWRKDGGWLRYRVVVEVSGRGSEATRQTGSR